MNNVTRCNRVRRMGGVAALVTWLVWGLGCGQAFDREAVLVEARKAGQRKDYREAVRLLREVLAHVPHDAETRYDLGQTLLRSGRPFQARLQFFQTVQLDSTHRDALRHLGLLAYQAGDQTEALEMLERAVRAGVREAHIHDKLGILYSEAGWVEEAKAQIREVLRLHPGQLRNRLNLATLNQETGAYDNARQELEGIVADFPNNWDAHFSLGKVYRELGQSEAAVLSLERALVLKPNDAEIHYQLGAARLQAGHLEGARSASQDAIRLSPNHAGAHYCLGQTYTRMGRPEKAKVALARFRELQREKVEVEGQPRTFLSYWRKGMAKDVEGDYTAAAASLRKALQIYPNDLFTRILLWQVYHKQRREKKAEEMFRTIQSRLKGRRLADVCTKLGVLLIHRGAKEKAVEVLEEAVARDPGLERARYYLVVLYHRLGQTHREAAHTKALEERTIVR